MHRRRAPLCLFAVLLLGCTPPATGNPPPAAAVHGHFVLLGQARGETVAYARVVLDPGYSCPSVTGGSTVLAMTTRDNDPGFPVIVCEARIGFDETLKIELQDATLDLPPVRRDPRRIVVFGDTGCKLAKEGEDGGCPAGSPAEPFASLARSAAQPPPDLILHMGDYNYRGTPGPIYFTERQQDGTLTQVEQWPYDAGDGSTADAACEQRPGTRFWSQNAANANFPDTWEAWRDDFLSPAGELLSAAPWVFTRGNHELCSRAGPGWFYLLDPSSNLAPGGGAQERCPEVRPAADPVDQVVLSEPYAVDLGSLTLVVLDSANACDSFTQATFTGRYEEQLKSIARLVAEKETAWLLSHRPLWGVTGFEADKSTGCSDENRYGCINQTLQKALDEALAGALPENVRLLLAGHMHRFQSLSFPDASRPPVVVVGTGGVALDPSPPVGALSVAVDGEVARGVATGAVVEVDAEEKEAFGFLDIQFNADGTWSGTLHDPAEELTLARCGSEQAAAGQVCELSPGVVAE